ncbi:NUDIX domain-containing protein [Schaalia sp. 19OD2882]|uniref:(deoxy)nucleoside triphosphate pyrophosphohydrolase n=1 Tax=Schaalia sp. 19OD2882 TaxID=2794089 RepID=UPI001C1EA7FD|nr:NUDIX domain-containing protein [Schaalia sp. 19OD2882]QWW19749.1 NUDIX domain-containing protein [Schaalia sp. 19OD2882]
MSPRPVVAAAILDSLARPTRLLCAARAHPQALRGQFELPGGKVEEGEAPVAALVREIREELGCDLVLGAQVPGPDGQWWPILQGRRMGVWLAEVAPDSPAPRAGKDHVELRWVPIGEVDSLPWLALDLPIAEAVSTACRTLLPFP